ncbi:unnamed protein product [Nesidiocoris tenuis]|uniref:Uncharacterized protein n=1 Tax=Nesidiocoris tenuis TaxID=355587 RepID=A0A6H5G9R3_9HEMI|nr:unnamed protein product [Nesidiocoris tenuis]
MGNQGGTRSSSFEVWKAIRKVFCRFVRKGLPMRAFRTRNDWRIIAHIQGKTGPKCQLFNARKATGWRSYSKVPNLGEQLASSRTIKVSQASSPLSTSGCGKRTGENATGNGPPVDERNEINSSPEWSDRRTINGIMDSIIWNSILRKWILPFIDKRIFLQEPTIPSDIPPNRSYVRNGSGQHNGKTEQKMMLSRTDQNFRNGYDGDDARRRLMADRSRLIMQAGSNPGLMTAAANFSTHRERDRSRAEGGPSRPPLRRLTSCENGNIPCTPPPRLPKFTPTSTRPSHRSSTG